VSSPSAIFQGDQWYFGRWAHVKCVCVYHSLSRGHNLALKTHLATAASLHMSDRFTIGFAFPFKTLIGM